MTNKFPNKRYDVIYADPPWTYRDKRAGYKISGGAESHYDCLTIEDIKNLPVESIAKDNAVLFIWITFPLLEEVFSVIRSWGFEYKTLGFDWTKLNKNGSVFFGIGSYSKSNNEVCLFATRGSVGRLIKDEYSNPLPHTKDKLRVQSNYVSSNVQAQREKHSKKPNEVRKRIEELFGECDRIELFARKSHSGWDSWGNEIDD